MASKCLGCGGVGTCEVYIPMEGNQRVTCIDCNGTKVMTDTQKALYRSVSKTHNRKGKRSGIFSVRRT